MTGPGTHGWFNVLVLGWSGLGAAGRLEAATSEICPTNDSELCSRTTPVRPELTKRPSDTHKETKQERQAALRNASDRVRSGLNPALFSDMACSAPHT